jgi:hypothetical protein
MKKILVIKALILSSAFLYIGCKKNTINYGETQAVGADQALLKFNFVSTYITNPSVVIKINGNRVSSPITARTPFPGGGYNTGGGSAPDYLVVNPGNLEVAVVVLKKGTDIDSLQLYKTNITLESGKNYTAHIADTSANTTTVLATDDFAKPDSGFSKYKFVNLMPNVAAIDLYYGTTVVAANIPYKGVSNYFTMATPATSLAWTIRPAGSAPTSTALATYTSASTTTNQRIYTAFALGYSGATDATRKPYISFLLNR